MCNLVCVFVSVFVPRTVFILERSTKEANNKKTQLKIEFLHLISFQQKVSVSPPETQNYNIINTGIAAFCNASTRRLSIESSRSAAS